jgi:hypothetical protein
MIDWRKRKPPEGPEFVRLSDKVYRYSAAAVDDFLRNRTNSAPQHRKVP